jgi:hypothetical protein
LQIHKTSALQSGAALADNRIDKHSSKMNQWPLVKSAIRNPK